MPLAYGPGRRWGRAPRVRRPPPPANPNPSRKGGFVLYRLILVLATVAAVVLLAGPAVAPDPHRIVSLSPTATESLFAIGAGKQVVAVDDQSDYPKRAPKTTLSGFTPNVEAGAADNPDLVVVGFDAGFVAQLQELGMTVLY